MPIFGPFLPNFACFFFPKKVRFLPVLPSSPSSFSFAQICQNLFVLVCCRRRFAQACHAAGLGDPEPKFGETFGFAMFCQGSDLFARFLPRFGRFLPRFSLKIFVFCLVLPGSFGFTQIRRNLFIFVRRFAQACLPPASMMRKCRLPSRTLTIPFTSH